MSRDMDIERIIEDGKRNLDAKELIHNWCRHARVEKHGGTGLIEIQTGLPIGHHAMACDFASPLGMATYLLEESAVHFHDAHCVSCTKRIPMALPNLSKLVARRDDALKTARARAEEAQRAKDAALKARSAERATLRQSLPVLAKGFLDDLDRLDAERSEEAATRLIESARLAPEILTTELIDHLFSILEGEGSWLDQPGLTMLAQTADQPRLVRCAMKCLANGHALDLAAATVVERLDSVDPANIAGAVIGFAYVAAPPRSEFAHGEPDRSNPGPLLRLAKRFPEETGRGLKALLTHRDLLRVGLAARAMAMLMASDTRWVSGFVRPLAAQLSRVDVLVDAERESQLRKLVHDLRQALTQAFLAFPELTDSELLRQFESASSDGEDRLAGVYEHVLRHSRGDRDPNPSPAQLEAFMAAITRLVALAGTSENSDVTQHVLSALRITDAALAPVAMALMDLLLGTAAVLDSKLQAPPPQSPVLTPPSPMAALEQSNRHSHLYYLRSALIEFAIHGACASPDGLRYFEEFLSKRGVLGDSLEAAILREISPLLKTSAGLQAMLPYLYGAMVSASVLGRSAAATALKDIGHRRFSELPDLVAESLFLMLFDPYVMVHKAAVDALSGVRLPERFDRLTSRALDNLIAVYRSEDKPEFLLTCIEARVQAHRGDAAFPEAQARILVALLAELPPSVLLRSGHYYFINQLQHADGWVDLVLSLVARCEQDYELEHALKLVGNLPVGSSTLHIPGIMKAVAADPSNTQLCSTFVELLTRDRAWVGATQVAALHVASIPVTPRERARRLHAQQLEQRTQFERFLSERRIDEAFSAGKAWMAAEKEITDIFENDAKSNPFRSLLGAPASR